MEQDRDEDSENALEAIRERLKKRYGAKDTGSAVADAVQGGVIPSENVATDTAALARSLMEDLDEDYDVRGNEDADYAVAGPVGEEHDDIDHEDDQPLQEDKNDLDAPVADPGQTANDDNANYRINDDEEANLDRDTQLHDMDAADTSAKLADLLTQLHNVVEKLESKGLVVPGGNLLYEGREGISRNNTIEDVTVSILHREIRSWLEHYLPQVVKEIVDGEIQRLLPYKYKR